MNVLLTEVAALEARWGTPLRSDIVIPISPGLDPAAVQAFFANRWGEVVMVLLRPEDARVWVMTKSSFPIGLYSLPTGGIRPGEGIWAALARELQEETGFPLQVRRFLALIRYLPQASETGFTDLPGFVSYVFLLDAPRGVAPVLSCDEAILDFKAVGGENLVTLAQHWRRLSGKNEAFHDLAAWGLFRSVAHELVGNWLLGDGRRHG